MAESCSPPVYEAPTEENPPDVRRHSKRRIRVGDQSVAGDLFPTAPTDSALSLVDQEQGHVLTLEPLDLAIITDLSTTAFKVKDKDLCAWLKSPAVLPLIREFFIEIITDVDTYSTALAMFSPQDRYDKGHINEIAEFAQKNGSGNPGEAFNPGDKVLNLAVKTTSMMASDFLTTFKAQPTGPFGKYAPYKLRARVLIASLHDFHRSPLSFFSLLSTDVLQGKLCKETEAKLHEQYALHQVSSTVGDSFKLITLPIRELRNNKLGEESHTSQNERGVTSNKLLEAHRTIGRLIQQNTELVKQNTDMATALRANEHALVGGRDMMKNSTLMFDRL